MVTAIWYVLRTGCPWRDVPGGFGPWSSVYTRWRRWCECGLWARMLALLSRGATGALRHLDCSHIKLHQHGANPRGGQSTQGIGRTKGGLNTKLAAVVDATGRVVAMSLAAGQRHDLKAIAPLVPALRGKRGQRPCGSFHRGYYRHRHHVENFFCRIKRFRRISTRYDKLARTFLAFVQLAAILDWLTHGV